MQKKFSKNQIIKQIKISDLFEEEKIALEESISGNFTHRCKCPFSSHKNGNEKTKSLFIDCNNNNFYCFGCGANNNSIDFYMALKSISFSDAISELSIRLEKENIEREEPILVAKTSNYPIILEISSLFRKLYRNSEILDQNWIDSLSRKVDEKIENLDPYDVSGARKILNQILNYLNKIGVSI